MKRKTPQQTQRAKSLRASQTEADRLLSNALRGRQLCKIKFRRQHPIDFACVAKRLVVELDGSYHDLVQEKDLQHQQYLADQGWKVIRFTNDEMLGDVDSVLAATASSLGVRYSYHKRTDKRSGMMSDIDPNTALSSPHPVATASDLPASREVKDE